MFALSLPLPDIVVYIYDGERMSCQAQTIRLLLLLVWPEAGGCSTSNALELGVAEASRFVEISDGLQAEVADVPLSAAGRCSS
jgi:hypothetical protein